MKEIDYKELRQLQLGILQRVHDFCIAHGIRYSLAYGTLLGAVRHGGYIPWDDDIDIAMLRPGYERFRKEFKDDILRFCDCRDVEGMNIGFGKVEDTRTLVIEGGKTVNLGVDIDVFPIDDLCDTFDESRRYDRSFNFNRFVRTVKYRELSIIKKWWKKPMIMLLKIVFAPFSSHKLAINAVHKAISHVNAKSSFVGLVTDIVFDGRGIVEREIWSDFSPITFEGRTFMAVKDTDAYLRHEYGDYMKLPPESEQVPKHDFNAIYWK